MDSSAKPAILLSHEVEISSVLFDPSGQNLAAASDDGQIWLWQTDNLEKDRTIVSGPGTRVLSLAFGPAAASGDRIAFLAATGQLSPGADRLAAVGELGLDGSVRPVRGGLAIADLATRDAMRELVLPAKNAGEAAALVDQGSQLDPQMAAAVGIDLDPEVLAWARDHNLARLKPDARKRVTLVEADMLEVQTPQAFSRDRIEEAFAASRRTDFTDDASAVLRVAIAPGGGHRAAGSVGHALGMRPYQTETRVRPERSGL